jgi:chemotaxis protein MotB
MQQNTMGWLTTFNDLVTLLMVFFVLLFTMSSIDSVKMSDFQNALQSGLGVLKEGQKVAIQVQKVIPFKDMANIKTQDEGGHEIKGIQVMHNKIKQVAQNLDFDIEFFYTEQGAHISLEDTLLFNTGKSEINAEGLKCLNKIASFIRKISYPIRVEGHTDNVPIKNKQFSSNWELSTARAVNVVKYLIDCCKIAPHRFSAVGYGESRPIFPNNSPEGRAKNRRVEIVLLKKRILK